MQFAIHAIKSDNVINLPMVLWRWQNQPVMNKCKRWIHKSNQRFERMNFVAVRAIINSIFHSFALFFVVVRSLLVDDSNALAMLCRRIPSSFCQLDMSYIHIHNYFDTFSISSRWASALMNQLVSICDFSFVSAFILVFRSVIFIFLLFCSVQFIIQLELIPIPPQIVVSGCTSEKNVHQSVINAEKTNRMPLTMKPYLRVVSSRFCPSDSMCSCTTHFVSVYSMWLIHCCAQTMLVYGPWSSSYTHTLILSMSLSLSVTVRIHQYRVNQLNLVKINLKSRIFGVHTIPKSDESQALWKRCAYSNNGDTDDNVDERNENENHQVGCCLRHNVQCSMLNGRCSLLDVNGFSVRDEVKSVLSAPCCSIPYKP